MLKANCIFAVGVVPLALGVSLADLAPDHDDSPALAVTERSADIGDLYAWLSNDTSKLNLVLTVNPHAEPDAWFSSDVTYAFSVSSSADLGEGQAITNVICSFVTEAQIECWAAGDYLIGDPRSPAGISSDAAKLRVFAGLRNDPSFIQSAGLDAVLESLALSVSNDEFELAEAAAGCPALGAARAVELMGMLGSGENGASPSDDRAGQNVLALVVQLDKSLVNGNGPVLGVWASSYSSASR